MNDRQLIDLKAQSVPSWLKAFSDFHSQKIADFLKNGNNKTRLGYFLRGQFYEHGLFGYSKSADDAIKSYEQGSKLQDPLSNYRLAEVFSHLDNPLKVTPDFEENVYYQALTISFMNSYYGDNIFDCLGWYENYLTIDPELSTLKRIISSKISSRILWISEFENVYQIQNLIINLLELRKPSELPQQFEEDSFRDSEEKELAQQAYDDILEFLSYQIERRSRCASSNQQSFAYETLFHLIVSQSLNENKQVNKYLPILIKYPLYLQSVTYSLQQEMDIMLLQDKDNSLFSHSRFILFEINNIVKALIFMDNNKINDPIVKQITQILQLVFTKLYEKIDSGTIKKQGEIVYIIRHLAQLTGIPKNRLNLEKAIRIQSKELHFSGNQENKEQFAFCHFKLASLRLKICQLEQINQAQNSKFSEDEPVSRDNMGTNIEQTFSNILNLSQEIFLDRDGHACSAQDYFLENKQNTKQSFQLAEILYNLRINNPEESPLGKLLSTYYMGRIHQKFHKNEQIALDFYLKTIETYNQKKSIFNNCRTTQFELIYLKALKRLGNIPSELNKPILEKVQKQIVNESSSFKIDLLPTVLQSSSKIDMDTENPNINYLSQSISEMNINAVPNNTMLEESKNNIGEQQISQIFQINKTTGQYNSAQQNCVQNLEQNYEQIQQTESNRAKKQENQVHFLSDLRNNFNYKEVKEIPAREIKIKQLIKKGQFGSVYRIQYKGSTYAGKLIQFVRRPFYEQIFHELKGNLLIDHEFVMPTLAISKWPSQKENNGADDPIHILLIMDLKKTCLEQIIREKQITSTNIAYRIARQVCNGLNVLHAFGVAHTNLKLQNILIDDNLNAFITDWGVSHLFFSEIDQKVDEFTSTFAFTAPEIHKLNEEQNLNDSQFEVDYFPQGRASSSRNKLGSARMANGHSVVHGKQADVWSFGIILLCLFFDFFPTEEQIDEVSLYQGVRLKGFHNLESMSLLVKDMLQINPEKRPNMFQVLQKLTSISQI